MKDVKVDAQPAVATAADGHVTMLSKQFEVSESASAVPQSPLHLTADMSDQAIGKIEPSAAPATGDESRALSRSQQATETQLGSASGSATRAVANNPSQASGLAANGLRRENGTDHPSQALGLAAFGPGQTGSVIRGAATGPSQAGSKPRAAANSPSQVSGTSRQASATTTAFTTAQPESATHFRAAASKTDPKLSQQANASAAAQNGQNPSAAPEPVQTNDAKFTGADTASNLQPTAAASAEHTLANHAMVANAPLQSNHMPQVSLSPVVPLKSLV